MLSRILAPPQIVAGKVRANRHILEAHCCHDVQLVIQLSAARTPSGLLFLAAIAAFLLTRAMTLTAFPIFNDEGLYLQYSQATHARR